MGHSKLINGLIAIAAASAGAGALYMLTSELLYYQHVKTKSVRKLSNFNFQWTKTLYQIIQAHYILFSHFSRGINVLSSI